MATVPATHSFINIVKRRMGARFKSFHLGSDNVMHNNIVLNFPDSADTILDLKKPCQSCWQSKCMTQYKKYLCIEGMYLKIYQSQSQAAYS